MNNRRQASWKVYLSWLAIFIFAALLAAGCGKDNDTGSGDDAKADKKASVTKFEKNEWGTFGYDFENTRHVPFTKITPENVKDLGVAYTVDFQKEIEEVPGGQQSHPLVVDDTMYTTTHFNHIFATDAKTGKVKWHYVPEEIGAFKNFGVTTNRGVAYCGGSVYMLTLDMKIVQVDAKTGKEQKVVEISRDVSEADAAFGYYETTAPICYKNILLIGSSGADNGVRGFVMAYNAHDLSPAWDSPHWNVPPEGEDWRAKGRFHGGGTTWMPVTVDTETDIVYFSSANPSPDFFAGLRPGDNPKTNSVIAVDLMTGEEKWWKQQLAPDEWDYDTAQPPMVYKVKIDGKEKKVVSVGTKEGTWFMYDAATGDPIHERVQVIDKLDHPALSPGKPVSIFPSALGGVNSAPSSFDPTSGFVIVNVIESQAVLIQAKTAEEVDKGRVRGDVDTGAINGFGETPKGWKDYGTIRAVDPVTGKLAWRVKVPEPERGGTTTTASGLAFAGGGDGVLRAIETRTGKVLWQFQTGAQISAAPTIYEVDNEQYVAVAVGGTFTSSMGGRMSKLMVFKLGGDKAQGKAPQTSLPPGAEAKEDPSDRSPLGKYLKLDESADKTVNLLVVGSEGSAAGGMNFNGYAKGEMTVTVPKGWKVNVTFKNQSAQVPHSVMISPYEDRLKVQEFEAAFDGAFSEDPEQGITSGTQYFSFTADKTGKYAMLCAVPGHSTAGMWDTFVVSDSGQPSISAGGETYTIEEAS